MKILVPSDFSKSSNLGALYAAEFSREIDAEMVLLHVVHFEHPPMVQISSLVEHRIEDIRVADACKDCVLLVEELKSKVKGIQISFKVIPGFPVADAIEGYVKTHKIDLIIMGINGEGGLSNLLFGRNAVTVINKSSVPVITVPESSSFSRFKHIVFASDMQQNEPELQKIVPIAKIFNASIDILHILPPESKKEIDISSIEDGLIEKYKYQKISFHLARNSDILDGIHAFVAHVKADVLAMHTHKIGFFERLFKTSFTRKEISHSFVPLLILKD